MSRLTSFIQAGNPRLFTRYPVKSSDEAAALLESKKMELLALSARIRRYKDNIKRKQQNQVFRENERQFYRSLGTQEADCSDQTRPGMGALHDFWSGIWSEPFAVSRHGWIEREALAYQDVQPQEDAVITPELFQLAVGRMPHWRAAGPDNIRPFWLKKFSALHPALLRIFQQLLDSEVVPPPWFSLGATVLLPKKGDLSKPQNWRPITCLPSMYKLFTSVVSELMWSHITANSLLAPEQVGCARGRGGCTDQLLINNMIIEDAKCHQRSLSMAWLDFRKAFDSLSQEWIWEIATIYKFDPRIIRTLQTLSEQWSTQLCLSSGVSEPISIRRGIFQGDSLSPLLFCIGLNPISNELARSGIGYRCGPTRDSLLSHLWYMDDVKLFAASSTGLDSLINIVECVGGAVGMQLSPTKCSKIVCPAAKPTQDAEPSSTLLTESIIHPLQDGAAYLYLGLREFLGIEAGEVKQSAIAEFRRRLRLITDASLCAANLIRAINTYVLPVVSYGLGTVVPWTADELRSLDRTVRKALTASRAHHPRASIRRLYLPRSEGGRGLVCIVDLHDRTCIRLAQYLKDREDVPALAAVLQHHESRPSRKSIPKLANTVLQRLRLTSLDTANKETVKQALNDNRRRELRAMPLHGRYWARVDGILDMQLSFSCFRSQTMRPETEGFLIACQDQVIATRNNMRHIHKRHDVVDLCRVCGAPGENMDHIIACCPALARTAYIARHNFVVQALHRALCKQHGLPSSKQLVQVTSSASCKLMWEISIPPDRVIKANRPDLVLVLDDRALLLDVSVPLDHRVNEKVQEKISKYLPLAAELRRIWNKKITIVPVIIGALGGVSGTSCSHILSLGLHASVIQRLQQCAILGTLRIVRSVTGHGWESGMVGTVG